MRIAYFGTDAHSARVLRRLVDGARERWLVRAAVCPPPPPQRPYPLEREARALGLATVHAPPRAVRRADRDWSPVLAACAACDLGVVYSFGYLLPAPLVRSFALGALNLHPSLLPRYRGPNPIQHAVLNGDDETAVSVIEVHPDRFDEGDVLAQRRLRVGARETASELGARLDEAGAALLMEVLADLTDARARRSRSQAELGASRAVAPSHAPKLSFPDRFLRLDGPARAAYDRWRALESEALLRVRAKGGLLAQVVLADEPREDAHAGLAPSPLAPAPGDAALSPDRSRLLARCADAWLPVAALKVEGKRECSADAFANGYLRAKPGACVRGVFEVASAGEVPPAR